MLPEHLTLLKEIAQSFLLESGGGIILDSCGFGGSAGVFVAERAGVKTAIKVYAPEFLRGENGASERRRLELQRRLRGHKCTALVDVFDIREFRDTAVVEMEFLPWSDLKDVLQEVPDEKVLPLIRQLVEAVRYLESLEIVHRDIKPENIKVSSDFSSLKLLDLGVARHVNRDAEDAPDATDYGTKRPFLATAQYSSPEYLFRLVEPDPRFWKALSIYQVGAVLHDLIKKEALFNDEVRLANKYVVAHAVLSKPVSFIDSDPNRLRQEKALAASCLTKDMNTRLALVDWPSFESLDGNAVLALQEQLKKRRISGADPTRKRLVEQSFERAATSERIRDLTRDRLIDICSPEIPVNCKLKQEKEKGFEIVFQLDEKSVMNAEVTLWWNSGLDDTPAEVRMRSSTGTVGDAPSWKGDGGVVGIANPKGESEEQLATSIVDALAKTLAAELQLRGSATN